jgi:hypothetical protein
MIYHKAVCKSIIPVRLSPRPDSLFANWKVKLGESRQTLYGVVDVQASDMQSFLLCLVVVPPIFANGAVYTLYRQTCMQTSGLAKKFSLGLGLEPRFRPGRSVPFRQVRISRRLSSLDMDRSVRKNEEHKREVSMRWYHAAMELSWGGTKRGIALGPATRTAGAISTPVRPATCLLNLAHSNSSGSIERSQDEVHRTSVGPFGRRQCRPFLEGAI